MKVPSSAFHNQNKMKKILAITLVLIFLVGCGKVAEKTGKTAVIETNKGIVKFELFTEKAPITTTNFVKLANNKFYDGLKFHRYVEGFVVQGGDPKGDGTGGSPDKIKLEVNPELKHFKGAVGMARSQELDSASSQFYFVLENANFLDGNYAVFGKVIEGMDVVMKLREGDVMEKVYIE